MNFFKEFEKYASDLKLPFLQHMAPGLQHEQIERELSISCDDINELYRWRNGVLDSSKHIYNTELCFFHFGYMVPLEKVKYYIPFQNSIPELAGKKLLLIFESGLGEAYLFDYDITSNSYGKIYFYTLDERFNNKLFVQFDSLDSFFKYVLKCYRENVFVFKNNDFTVTDMNREYEILLETNPGSQYWDSLADWWKLS